MQSKSLKIPNSIFLISGIRREEERNRKGKRREKERKQEMKKTFTFGYKLLLYCWKGRKGELKEERFNKPTYCLKERGKSKEKEKYI